MADVPRDSRQKFLNNALSMAEACLIACLATRPHKSAEFTEHELNEMAGVLAGLVTVFLLGDAGTTVRPLGKEEIRGGRFSDGGKSITFYDGRASLSGIVITRTAFKSALEILKDAGTRR